MYLTEGLTDALPLWCMVFINKVTRGPIKKKVLQLLHTTLFLSLCYDFIFFLIQFICAFYFFNFNLKHIFLFLYFYGFFLNFESLYLLPVVYPRDWNECLRDGGILVSN